MAEEKKAEEKKECRSDQISLQEIKRYIISSKNPIELPGKKTFLNSKYLENKVNKSCEEESKIKTEALREYHDSYIAGTRDSIFTPYVEPDKHYLEDFNQARKARDNSLQPDLSGTFYSFHIKHDIFTAKFADWKTNKQIPTASPNKTIDSFINCLVCLGLKSRPKASKLMGILKNEKKLLEPYYIQHLAGARYNKNGVRVPYINFQEPQPDNVREKRYPFATDDEVKKFFQLLSGSDGLMNSFYTLVTINNKELEPLAPPTPPTPPTPLTPWSPAVVPAHRQYVTQTFIIYKKQGQLWYIDSLKDSHNEKIDIQSPTQPWKRNPDPVTKKPKATITVLVRSAKRVYVEDKKDEEKETNFKTSYDTSHIRTFKKDQLFEVDAYSNLNQRILIKNLKTDIYQRKKGNKVIHDNIEGPYMLHVYNLTLNGIERKYYLFGEMHHDPAPIGHCGTPTPTPRFFQLIKKLMKESTSFIDFFFEEGITKVLGIGLRRWNLSSFINNIIMSSRPTLAGRINEAFNLTIGTIPMLYPELKEISNTVEICFPNQPPNDDCKLIKSHYIDNRTVYNLDKYNIMFFWLFCKERRPPPPAVGSLDSPPLVIELLYYNFKLSDFFDFLFQYPMINGNSLLAKYDQPSNNLNVPGAQFTRDLMLQDTIIITVSVSSKYIKCRGIVSAITDDQNLTVDLQATTIDVSGYGIVHTDVPSLNQGFIIQIQKLVDPNSTLDGRKLYRSIIYQNHNLNRELSKSNLKREIKEFIIQELDSTIINYGGAPGIEYSLYIFCTHIEHMVKWNYHSPHQLSTYPTDVLEKSLKFLESFFLTLSVLDMDIYLLARLFGPRTVDPKNPRPNKCYTSITYSGSSHTENYRKFFDYLITTGRFTVSSLGSFVNPNMANGCLDLTGFARTDSDLF